MVWYLHTKIPYCARAYCLLSPEMDVLQEWLDCFGVLLENEVFVLPDDTVAGFRSRGRRHGTLGEPTIRRNAEFAVHDL